MTKAITMTRTTICLIACFFATRAMHAQPPILKTDWNADLDYFQNTVHHNYSNLFYNVTAQQFDSAIAATRAKIGTFDDNQMRMELVKIVAMFHIGHTNVRRQWGNGEHFTSWIHNYPIHFYLFDDGLYIKSARSDYKEAVGGKVLRIGNKNADDALQAIRPYIAYENEQGYRNMLQYYLSTAEWLSGAGINDNNEKLAVVYLKDGKENTISIKAENPVETPRHGPISEPSNWVDAYNGLGKAAAPLWLREPGRLRYFE
jgi:hypothetical protein